MGNSPVWILFVEAVALDETAAYVFSEYRSAVVSAAGIGPPFVASVGSQPLPERCLRPSAVSDSPDPRDVPVANRVDREGRVWGEKHVDATAWPVETSIDVAETIRAVGRLVQTVKGLVDIRQFRRATTETRC